MCLGGCGGGKSSKSNYTPKARASAPRASMRPRSRSSSVTRSSRTGFGTPSVRMSFGSKKY